MQRFDEHRICLCALKEDLVWVTDPQENAPKNSVTIRSSGFEKSPIQKSFQKLFCLDICFVV